MYMYIQYIICIRFCPVKKNQHSSLLTGYFIQDAADIIFSGYAKASWEFLLHHVMVSQYRVYQTRS